MSYAGTYNPNEEARQQAYQAGYEAATRDHERKLPEHDRTLLLNVRTALRNNGHSGGSVFVVEQMLRELSINPPQKKETPT